MEHTAAEALAVALDELARGTARARPVSVSLPGPLLDALQSPAAGREDQQHVPSCH